MCFQVVLHCLPGAGAYEESSPASGAGVCGTSAIVSGTVPLEIWAIFW